MSVRVCVCVLLPMMAAFEAHGQSYVTDQVVITLRRGPSTQHGIIRNLNTGDEVQVLSEDNGNGYVRVRVPGDQSEGWVLSRYLVDEPVAADRLAAAERNLAAANARVAELEQRSERLAEELDATRQRLEEAETANAAMSSELSEIRTIAAEEITLRDQNDSLRRRLSELGQQADLLRNENTQLASRTRQNWFVLGAAVLVAGIVLGLILPHLRRRRRSTW